MKEGIKAVIFDIGGVLELPKIPDVLNKKEGIWVVGVHNYLIKKLKISLDQYFDSLDTTYAMSIEGKIPQSKVVKILSKNLKISSKRLVKLFYKAYKKNFKHNKQLFKQAFELKKKGYKIAILSDQWHLSKETLMPKKYTRNFDEVVVSCDVGIRKPNPKIYKLVLKKLKLKPKQTLFIDNQDWNIKPAQKLGMKTVLFRNNKQLFKQLEKFGIK